MYLSNIKEKGMTSNDSVSFVYHKLKVNYSSHGLYLHIAPPPNIIELLNKGQCLLV